MKDYFDDLKAVPEPVLALIRRRDKMDFEELYELRDSCEEYDWTFEFGLETPPHNLRPVAVDKEIADKLEGILVKAKKTATAAVQKYEAEFLEVLQEGLMPGDKIFEGMGSCFIENEKGDVGYDYRRKLAELLSSEIANPIYFHIPFEIDGLKHKKK